jgi:hypothetical protein
LLPCPPERFRAHQVVVAGATGEVLQAEWASYVVDTLQRDLDEHFNFYEDDMERSKLSKGRRLDLFYDYFLLLLLLLLKGCLA